MQRKILHRIDELWKKQCAFLLSGLDDTIHQLEDLLHLEDYHRHGHDQRHLQEALGPFAAGSLNLDALASVLGEAEKKRFLSPERYARIEALLGELRAVGETYRASPPAVEFANLDRAEAETHDRAEQHLNRMATLFCNLRKAQLEVRAKYDPRSHDLLFKEFNWRNLSPAELALCPPFVVVAKLRSDDRASLRKIMALLTSRKPIKVLALRTSLRKVYPPGSDPYVPATMDLETLPLALRGVYAMQSIVIAGDFEEQMARALAAPRPGIISLFWEKGAPDSDDFRVRAERALLSRTFPCFVYDPDRAPDFVSCFDLSGNPDPHDEWARQKVLYLDDEGREQGLERNFTFANFAAEEEEFSEAFTSIPKATPAEQVVPLSEYLTLTRKQRAGQIPYVTVLNKSRRLVRRVPSQSVVTQAADRQHLWRTLQEFAGVDNPHVVAASAELREQLDGEQMASLEQLRSELEAESKNREQVTLASAVRHLASRLTGVSPDQIPLEGLLATASRSVRDEPGTVSAPENPPQPQTPMAPGPPAQEGGNGPWIETALCTACDECMAINDRIFVYNEDKKAVIKDPRGGPYKDIVRAAEKCSAEIIHPGSPLDPSEKDAEKWAKRAAKFL